MSWRCPGDSAAFEAHKACLAQLRDSWRAALGEVKAKKKALKGDDSAIQSIEKTLGGQTCCHGSQIFAFKQAAFTLLQLLRLLPEPLEELPRIIVQLLTQMAREDISVLSHFLADCEACLEALSQQPLKLNSFQQLNQLCKDRFSTQNDRGGGFSWDLGSERLCRAAQRLAQVCGGLAEASEPLLAALLRLAAKATQWEQSSELLLACMEAFLKLASKELSIRLQYELSEAVVPLLKAGLRQSRLRRSALELSRRALEIEDSLLCPHLPALLTTALDSEAPELLSAMVKLGKLPAPGGRVKQLLEDPERCHVVLHFLQDADLELPDGARLKRIMQGDLSAAREALKDRRPTLEVVLEAVKRGGRAVELQAEGEKLAKELLNVKPGTQPWRQLLLCLETFKEVSLKLLAFAQGSNRLAVWAAVARWLRGIQSKAASEEDCRRVQLLVAKLSNESSEQALRVCLCYVLIMCFSPCSTSREKKLPNLEVVRKSPFCGSRAFLSLPAAVHTTRTKVEECRGNEEEVVLPLPCSFCRAMSGGTKCHCGAQLLTLDWSVLEASLVDAWTSERSVQNPQDFLDRLIQLRGPEVDVKEASKPLAEELRWLLAWALLGLCCCSPRDFLAAKSQEILSFFPMEFTRSGSWDASRVCCHAALLQCKDFLAALHQGKLREWEKGLPSRVSEPPAVLAQNAKGVVALLVEDLCIAKKAPGALQRLLGISMLLGRSIDDLLAVDQSLCLRLWGKHHEARMAKLCELLLGGAMKPRLRRVLPKMVPKLVLNQRMDRIKELMRVLDEELMPSFVTPLLPYILGDIAEESVPRISESFKVLEKLYGHKLAIGDICDAHWGTVLVRIVWNSDRRPVADRCREARACISRLVEALPSSQEKKREGGAAKRRKGELRVIDVSEPERGLTESGFLHALDIFQIIINGSEANSKWQEYCRLLDDSSYGEVVLDVPRFLRSAHVLLEMLGDLVHRFSMKIFELLQSASGRCRNVDSLRCWKLFLSMGTQRLKPLLPAIVRELLQLGPALQETDMTAFQELQKQVASLVMEYSQNQEVLLAFPPLPEHLRGSRNQLEKTLSKLTLQQRLELTAKQLESSHQAVRHGILEAFVRFMTQQRKDFKAVLSLPDEVLARVMKALLKFTSESTVRGSQLLAGRALGALGAIDPARFTQQVVLERQNRSQNVQKGELELAKSVLEDFLAPHLNKNSFAFAAQEILKNLKSSGKDQLVMAKLNEDSKEALQPCRTSEYQSLSGTSLCRLGGVLAEATKLLPLDRRSFFEACLPATPGNHALSLFLLHHALHELIVGADRNLKLSALAQELARLLSFAGEPDGEQAAGAQAVFSLLDDLFQKKEEVSSMPIGKAAGDLAFQKRQEERIDMLLEPFSERLVMKAALHCGAYPRALQFLEMDLLKAPRPLEIQLGEEDSELLQRIYRELGEPDGVVGAIRIGPSARTRTSELELQGRWSDLQACYEHISGHQREKALCGLVQCTQAMRRYESSLQLIRGIQQELPELKKELQPRSVEAAWQLSSWDRLEEALQAPGEQIAAHNFQVQLGDALLQLHRRDDALFQKRLEEATVELAQATSMAARDSYARAYPHQLRLHVLSDLQWLYERQEPALADQLLKRVDVATPSFTARQELLRPLKVALQDLNLRDEAKMVDLAFTRLCRKHKEVLSMEHPDSFSGTSQKIFISAQIEWGKMLYASGAHHDALRHMQRLSCPRARLFGARWATEASLLLPRVAEMEFQEAKEKLKNEAAFFHHASYLDSLLKGQISDASASEAPAAKKARTEPPFDQRNLVAFTIRGYMQALQRGTKRLHFILNRLLQLAWECCEVDFHKQEMLSEFTQEAPNIPPCMWYTVLSQLICRVFHPDLQKAFCDIIKRVIPQYPQQAGWHMMQLVKSTNQDHARLGKEIMQDVSRVQEHHRLLCTRMKLAEDFAKLASMTGDAVSLKEFPRLLGPGAQGRVEHWQVLIPLQSQMTATIPRMDGMVQKGENNFPEMILAERCLEHVEVFRSKERPKKVTFVGSDGRHYPFLCKAEKRGDLRKDSRLMEFAAMVNQLLGKSPDANRRNLMVRTFQVVIIHEKCGLLEWVPKTKGLRYIIDDLWKCRKPARQSLIEIKDLFDRSKDAYQCFTQQVLPRHPPVLQKWFLKSGDPSTWFAKRRLFSQSQALWCMLGYLVGLGDRHGENILLDTESGRMVHVDFDCLFNKGMLLEKPELVPFRLTQNCVAAMGVTGVEGVFRQCCEVAMEVLRDHRETLLSVLHVFVADPLLEITKKPPAGSAAQQAAHLAEQRVQVARETISDVEKKLKGMLNVGAFVEPCKDPRASVVSRVEQKKGLLGRDRGVGLSVKGQVDELIKAATCKRNLSEMYVGWQPWL